MTMLSNSGLAQQCLQIRLSTTMLLNWSWHSNAFKLVLALRDPYESLGRYAAFHSLSGAHPIPIYQHATLLTILQEQGT